MLWRTPSYSNGKNTDAFWRNPLAGLLMALWFVAATSPVVAAEPPLRVAIKGEPASLDPHRKKVIWDQFVAYRLFDTLTQYSKTMRIVPALAEGWVHPDPLTLVVQIRKGVTFHDGSPLTAADVVYTFDRIRDKHSNYAGIFSKIESYLALDEHRIEIKTYEPFDSFHQFNNIFIVPRDYIETVGEDAFARNPIGSGPYQFVAGDTKRVSLTANTSYWKQPPSIKDAVIVHVPRDQQYAALTSGEVDIVQDLLDDEFVSLQNNKKFNTYIGHSNLYHYLGMDVGRPKTPKVAGERNPFLSADVRLAIAKAIDISAINREVFGDRAFPANQLANSAVFGFSEEIPTISMDIDGARALMASAGFADGFSVVLNTPLGAREEVARLIAKQLRAINVDVTVEPVEDKLFWKELFKADHSYSLFVAGFSVGHTVEHSLKSLFTTKDGAGQGRLNFFGYSNPQVDAVLKEAGAASNTQEKARLFKEANKTIMENRPIIPLYSTPQLYGLSKRIDWKPTFSSKIRIEDVKFSKNEESLIDRLMSAFD